MTAEQPKGEGGVAATKHGLSSRKNRKRGLVVPLVPPLRVAEASKDSRNSLSLFQIRDVVPLSNPTPRTLGSSRCMLSARSIGGSEGSARSRTLSESSQQWPHDDEQDPISEASLLRMASAHTANTSDTHTPDPSPSSLHTLTHMELRGVNSSRHAMESVGVLMPRLVDLKLTACTLASFRHLGTSLTRLRILRAPNCGISDLDGVCALVALEELYLAFNDIEDCDGFAMGHDTLAVLDLEGNRIATASAVEALRSCLQLTCLMLTATTFSQQPHYRQQVCAALPQLTYLDDTPVTASDQQPPPSSPQIHTHTHACVQAHGAHLADAHSGPDGDDTHVCDVMGEGVSAGEGEVLAGLIRMRRRRCRVAWDGGGSGASRMYEDTAVDSGGGGGGGVGGSVGSDGDGGDLHICDDGGGEDDDEEGAVEGENEYVKALEELHLLPSGLWSHVHTHKHTPSTPHLPPPDEESSPASTLTHGTDVVLAGSPVKGLRRRQKEDHNGTMVTPSSEPSTSGDSDHLRSAVKGFMDQPAADVVDEGGQRRVFDEIMDEVRAWRAQHLTRSHMIAEAEAHLHHEEGGITQLE